MNRSPTIDAARLELMPTELRLPALRSVADRLLNVACASWCPGAWCRRRGGGVARRAAVGRPESNAA